MNKLFTPEVVTKYSKLRINRDIAQQTIRNLSNLGISISQNIEQNLESFIIKYDEAQQKYLDFYKDKLQGLLDELEVEKITGAFVTCTTGTHSLSTSLTLHTKRTNYHLVYRPDKDIFTYTKWSDTPNDKFNKYGIVDEKTVGKIHSFINGEKEF